MNMQIVVITKDKTYMVDTMAKVPIDQLDIAEEYAAKHKDVIRIESMVGSTLWEKPEDKKKPKKS